jgi:hypothetical protein
MTVVKVPESLRKEKSDGSAIVDENDLNEKKEDKQMEEEIHYNRFKEDTSYLFRRVTPSLPARTPLRQN